MLNSLDSLRQVNRRRELPLNLRPILLDSRMQVVLRQRTSQSAFLGTYVSDSSHLGLVELPGYARVYLAEPATAGRQDLVVPDDILQEAAYVGCVRRSHEYIRLESKSGATPALFVWFKASTAGRAPWRRTHASSDETSL